MAKLSHIFCSMYDVYIEMLFTGYLYFGFYYLSIQSSELLNYCYLSSILNSHIIVINILHSIIKIY